MKPAAFPALRATRLLDQVHERIRYKHYSLRTEQAYVQWVKVFVKWSGLRHPRDMGGPEIEAFLTMLATERRVAASTHNQALSALLFLYREVLTIDRPWARQHPAAFHAQAHSLCIDDGRGHFSTIFQYESFRITFPSRNS